ncbi:MAG: dihydroxy-acid dehydratase [Clostridiales bacterium]|uniref:dihydroxy-acid dehydratase n=1 Tax=Provencibacterium massiliense TaxID=1841868 RepID=UPI0009A5989F|nr:dihydroxy-acid dehydratase [Provencibacterium massiliense]PWM38554.1 MAG: dihydroxy-acid dehydratase [Clostridiales bacterium]RGB63895.1 dihydroxy-acid dehydratase [Harryflintia acetispora]
MRRSEEILRRPDYSFNRGVYKSMGFSDEDLRKPIIGVANTWSEVCPGSYNLRALAQSVKNGIYAAGGTPVEFGVIGACDGTAQGSEGMKYILPSRELIANDVEVMVQAHRLDGVVLLGSCDKIVPGLLMAAARLRLPAILLPGGPMQGGAPFDGRASDLTSLSEGCGMLKAGKIASDELDALEESCCPGCGSCSFYGTANTMCCLGEALGMTLPGGALIPAVYAERTRMAHRTGEAAVRLVKENLTADKIINRESISNAIRVLNATGGSTNGVLHLTAVALEAGLSADEVTGLFEALGDTTPLIAKVNPASKYNMEDFYLAGGIPQVLRELSPLLERGALTVTGKTVGENIENYHYRAPNREVIKTLEEPFSRSGGVAILRGNLAPEGCVTKPSAIVPEMHVFHGTARVFDCEEAAETAILGGEIAPGTVLVIRYEGPKGGPGMREMYKAMKYLYGMGLATSTAIVTDGRFSGTNNGCFCGHVSPEAAAGGPIAAVRDGDRITIDIPAKTITLEVGEEEIARRLALWQPPKQKYKTGYLAIYEKLATSASRGAVLNVEN